MGILNSISIAATGMSAQRAENMSAQVPVIKYELPQNLARRREEKLPEQIEFRGGKRPDDEKSKRE